MRTAGDARVALATGGGRGIGQAISLKLASDGFDVALVYKADLGVAETVAERIRDIGQKALTLRSDMADPKAASDLGERTTAGLGRLDVLVGNASWYRRGPASLRAPRSRWMEERRSIDASCGLRTRKTKDGSEQPCGTK